MEENFVDPNQLNLFDTILTPARKNEVDGFLKRKEEYIARRELEISIIEELLISNGFVKDVHFVNEFKTKRVVENREFGHSYDDVFEYEIEYLSGEGNIYLIIKSIDKPTKCIKNIKGYFHIEDDKMECYMLTGNYRRFKPSTILDKLIIYNSNKEWIFNKWIEQENKKQSIISTYQEKYPDATFESTSKHIKGKYYSHVIKVSFKSGSYILLDVNLTTLGTTVLETYDVGMEKLGVVELFDKFYKQPKSLDS